MYGEKTIKVLLFLFYQKTNYEESIIGENNLEYKNYSMTEGESYSSFIFTKEKKFLRGKPIKQKKYIHLQNLKPNHLIKFL